MNADDNEYPKGEVPQLTFNLAPDKLILINNESGFKERHVKALCSVGESSKANKIGYIGEKGIGFKSVFTVSNAPEIHSNGFHFKFDRTNQADLLGYVVPHWCEQPKEAKANTTTIILPAADGFEFGDETLESLDAKLLLFLSKVREISLEQRTKAVTYARQDEDEFSNLVTRTVTSGDPAQTDERRYLRVAVDFSMEKYPDEKRPDVLNSTVVLAFPVDRKGAASPDPSSQVFAFLPIRQVGFKFSIQADFILNSSREDILTARPWNKFLRAAISATFKTAVHSFKRSDELAFSYLRYLPTEVEIADPYFKTVADDIHNALATTESLPSAAGKWMLPSALRLAEKRFRELFPSEVALELFGFDYVDQRVEGGSDLLRRLGAKDVQLLDVLNVFSQHGIWLKAQSDDWKARFFAYVADLDVSKLIKAGLGALPCVPINSGDFVVPDETSVFYPLNKAKKYGFEDELVIIDSELLENAQQHSERVQSLFAQLKVRSDDPYDLVTSHILRKHLDDSWKNSENKAVIGHLRYVKDKLKQYLEGAALAGKTESQAFQALRDGMWIGTKHNKDGSWSFDRSSRLYLSKEYKPGFCIETLLGDAIAESRLVSPAYLVAKAKDTEAEAESWRDFLRRLGLCFSPTLKALGSGDWQCSEELQLLLGASQSSIRKATLECIDQNWSQYANCLTYNLQTGRTVVQKDTQFAVALRGMQTPTKKKTGVPLSEAFYPTPEILDLFGDRLPYVDATISGKMLDACRVTYRVDARACTKRLKQLKVEGGETVKQLQAIYRHLERLWDSDSAHIKLAFNVNGLIRIKGTHSIWATPAEVAWRSNGLFLDSLYPPLQSQYKDFSGFFLNKLGIPKDLPTAKWVDALSKLSKVATIEERRREALAIYKRANRDLTPHFGRDAVPTPDWLAIFEAGNVFLNQRGELVSNDDQLFANDAPDLATLFSDDPDISFLGMPADEVPRIGRLLDATNVQRLSASVVVEVVEAGGGRLDTQLTARTRRAALHLGRVLYSRSHESFQNALEGGLFLRLRELEVMEVPDIKLSVSLGRTSRNTTADIAQETGRILIKKGTRSVNDQLASELCKFLGTSEELADTFARVLMAEDTESAEDFLRVRRIGPLPSDLLEALEGEAGSLLVGEEHDVLQDSEVEETTAEHDGDSSDFPVNLDAQVDGSMPVIPSPSHTSAVVPSSSGDTSRSTKDVTTASPEVHSLPAGLPKSMPIQTRPNISEGIADNDRAHDSSENIQPKRGSADVDVGTKTSSLVRERLPNGDKVGSTGAEFEHNEPPDAAGNPAYPRLGSKARAPSSSRSRRGQSDRPRTKSGRLMSYAAAPGDSDRPIAEDDPARAAAREATGKAAVDYFIATQAARWKSLTPMPHNNPGFDVHAVTHEGFEEFIEVKGQSDAWTEAGVALTPKELLTAQQKGEKYWLCVVEYVHDEKRRSLYLISNPFGLTQQFRFDSGWKSAAISEPGVPQKPEAGMCIDIPEGGRGRIQSVRKKGRFFSLHVMLDSGRQANKLFNPATMKLSVG